ncbi:hypothetical protein TRFO_07624 [Tritrichomonas foetus]|uniref:Amino acid transporter transmembrane domain-containing protein n=1 Tax=Tritrichomonas foetus TaxID=1144522 RepID=A0A1J4JV22_9EUKA|nr:hypothetical protein TRFO_07624 [Tritrichomonas foetus]|eukprot:OHT01372.1 hypothetical protein TRFO_07624 [Tritrichomonas foetus]
MIGKDIHVQNHKFKLRNKDEKFVTYRSRDNTRPLGFLGAFSLLMNIIIAEEPFNMPALYLCGIIQAPLIQLIMFVLNLFSFYIFFSTWVFGNTFSYGGIAAIATPKFVYVIIKITLIFSYITFTLHFAESIPNILISLFTIKPGCPSFILNKWFLYYVFSFITVFPTLFYPSMSSFISISIIGNIALLISMIAFFWGYSMYDTFHIEPVYFTSDFQLTAQLIYLTTSLCFINPVIHYIFLNSNRVASNNIKSIIFSTNISVYAIVVSIGAVGYFLGARIDNIIDIFPETSPYSIIGKIGIVITMLSSNSHFIYIIAINLCNLILKGSEKSTLPVVSSGIVVIVFNALILFSTLKTGFVIVGIIGTILQCFLNFGFPSILFLKFFQFSSTGLSIICVLLIICTLFLCVVLIYTGYNSFLEILES